MQRLPFVFLLGTASGQFTARFYGGHDSVCGKDGDHLCNPSYCVTETLPMRTASIQACKRMSDNTRRQGWSGGESPD